MVRFLVGTLRVTVLYILIGASLYFVLDTINRLRIGLENRWETQYGMEILDREPPYGWGERVIMMLDIEPGIYWQEAALMAAIMAVPITLGLSLSAFYKGRRRTGFLILAGMILNGFMLGAVYKIPEMESLNIAFAGYLIANQGAIFLPAVVCGCLHGLFVSQILKHNETGTRKRGVENRGDEDHGNDVAEMSEPPNPSIPNL